MNTRDKRWKKKLFNLIININPPDQKIKSSHMSVSQNEAAGTGSLSQGSVSRVCFVVCFGDLFRGSVSHFYLTQLNSRGLFRGMFRGSVSPKSNIPALLKVALPKKKCKPISIPEGKTTMSSKHLEVK